MPLIKVYALLCIILITGCDQENNSNRLSDRGISYSEQFKLDSMIRELEKRGVKYSIDDRGVIRYPLEQLAEVLGAERVIDYGLMENPDHLEELVILNDIHLSLYEKYLSKESIPYMLSYDFGERRLLWRQYYGLRVDVVRQKVELEYRELENR